MPHVNDHYAAWVGRMLTDASGRRIGKIDDIYIDDDTGQPEWLAVTSGLMGPYTHIVPLREATFSRGGVQVPFPKDQVKVAPSTGADGRLSRMEKGRLYAHYGYTYAEERNRLQRALGFDPPRPPDGPFGSRAVDLRDVGGPPDMLALPPAPRPEEPDLPTAPRAEEPDRQPTAACAEGRGRWPDDEAIFGLSQLVAHPSLAASGASRRR